MMLALHYNSRVCTGNAGSFRLTPSFSDACFPLIRTTGTPGSFSLTAPGVPSLEVTKQSSIDAGRLEIVRPGDTVFFTVTVFGNTGDTLINTPIDIVDTLPPSLVEGGLITVSPPAVLIGDKVF